MQETYIALSVFRSTDRFEDTLYMNHFKNHLSYISDFDQYGKRFQCKMCRRIFEHKGNFKQHGKTCENKTKFVYPGGFYQKTNTIFEELDLLDIHVDSSDRYFPYFAVYDFESVLSKMDESTEKLKFTHRHIPISVSVCSNLPGFEQASCFVDSDLDALLSSMIKYLQEIQRRSAELAEVKWGWVLEEIMSKMSNYRSAKPVDPNTNNDDDDDDGDEAGPEVFSLKHLANLHEKVSAYMHCLPVFGFNSAKYDLPLVKSKLAKHMRMDEQKRGFTVKKASSYACIQSDHFRFMDASHFLGPGTSYAGFLKADQV